MFGGEQGGYAAARADLWKGSTVAVCVDDAPERAVERVAEFHGGLGAEVVLCAAAQGVPMAGLLVPLSGVFALAGGLSILLGYRAKIGGWLLAAFMLPVTIMMHNFWAVTDPTMARMQQVMFMKNLAILGGALLISYFGAGALSLDARIAAGSSRRREEAFA